MAQNEYKEIKSGDWESLRYAVRRFNERLSDLEGRGGTTKKLSDTDMLGNKIVSGPPNQTIARSDEFITKNYLRSQEAANIVNANLKYGGLSPLIIPNSGSGPTGATGPTGLTGETGVTGPGVAGTTGKIAKFTSGTAIGNSIITETTTGIGIGTTTPGSLLQVGSLTETVPATYTGTLKVTGGTQTTLAAVGGIELPVAGDGYSTKIQALSAAGASLVFAGRQGSATWVEYMRIDSSGKVGIGTNNPQALLDVKGASTTRVYSTAGDSTGYGFIGVYNENASAELDLLTYGSAAAGSSYGITNAGNVFIMSAVASDMSYGTATNHPIHFITNSTIKATIKASGVINFTSMPTSAAGLSTGDIWVDTTGGLNILKIV